MSDLISKQAVINLLKGTANAYGNIKDFMADMVEFEEELPTNSDFQRLREENEKLFRCLNGIANRPIGVFGEEFGWEFHYKSLKDDARRCLNALSPQKGETEDVHHT